MVNDMKDKLIKASKIIAELGPSYKLYDWHKACVAILDTGLTLEELEAYVEETDCRKAVLADAYKSGNLTAVANYVWNFLSWNDSMPWVMDYADVIPAFLDYMGESYQYPKVEISCMRCGKTFDVEHKSFLSKVTFCCPYCGMKI